MRLAFTILFLFYSTLGFTQDELLKRVCGLDCSPLDQGRVKVECAKLPPDDELNSYLIEIKKALKDNDPLYVVKNITKIESACALHLKADYVIERAIAVNKSYYTAKMPSGFHRAMFIWILGHEITHHKNYDNFYLDEGDELKNLSKELLCDENGGYLIGLLTNDITLNQVGIILTNILSDNDTSIYHPALRYRIFAAQAGWLRAKTEKWGDDTLIVLGDTISKSHFGTPGSQGVTVTTVRKVDSLEIVRNEYNDGSLYFGSGGGDGLRNGYGVSINVENNEIDYLCFGNSKDGVMNGIVRKVWHEYTYIGDCQGGSNTGKCILTWRLDEQKYIGNILNNEITGFGTYYYSDGTTYTGEFINGKKNGFGVLYKGYLIVNSGYWKDNVFVKK